MSSCGNFFHVMTEMKMLWNLKLYRFYYSEFVRIDLSTCDILHGYKNNKWTAEQLKSNRFSVIYGIWGAITIIANKIWE